MDNIILPQIISAGLYNSRLVYKGIKLSKKRTTNLFEIELPVQNIGKTYIENESLPVSVDTVVFLKPNQARYTRLPYMCYYVHFIVTDGLLYDVLMGLPSFITIKDRNRYLEILKNIDRHNQPSGDTDNIILQSCMLDLIYSLSKDAASQTQRVNTGGNSRQIIENAIKYIDDNLSGNLTLKSVSERVSLSPVYFHKLFKSSTGLTLHDYVEERRIKKAVNYLISTNMTLTEVAFECGFSSQSYFSFAFKRRMKESPRSYVKSLNEKYDMQ